MMTPAPFDLTFAPPSDLKPTADTLPLLRKHYAANAQEVGEYETGIEVDNTAGGHAPVPFWQDTTFWVLIPFLIVVYLLVSKGVPKLVGQTLDTKSKEISDELEAARALKEEAQELLATYQRQQRKTEDEAAGIIEQAREDAKRMANDARAKIDEQLVRRTKAAEQKIERAQAQAIAGIRNQTVEIAISAAEQVLTERVDENAQSALINRSIAQLGSKLT